MQSACRQVRMPRRGTIIMTLEDMDTFACLSGEEPHAFAPRSDEHGRAIGRECRCVDYIVVPWQRHGALTVLGLPNANRTVEGRCEHAVAGRREHSAIHCLGVTPKHLQALPGVVSQNRAVASMEAVTTSRPSGEKTADFTTSICPTSAFSRTPELAAHKHAVVSQEAVTTS